MGIQRTDVVLQPSRRNTSEFLPGETVSGRLVLQIDGHKHKLDAVTVKVRGKAATDWTTGSGDSKTRHWATEWLLRLDLPLLLAKADGRPAVLSPGQHQYPFTFSLPHKLAYSQKHADGKVSYEIKGRALSHSFWSFNGKARAKFDVLPWRDLSRVVHLSRPLVVQRKARSSLFGRDPGPFQVHLPRQAFVAGEVIDLWLDGPDRAFEVLADADGTVQLKARLVFRAGSSTTQSKRIPAAVRPGRSPAAWRHIQLTVPEGEITMDDSSGCSIISVTHYVKLRDLHLPVTLGTVPLSPS